MAWKGKFFGWCFFFCFFVGFLDWFISCWECWSLVQAAWVMRGVSWNPFEDGSNCLSSVVLVVNLYGVVHIIGFGSHTCTNAWVSLYFFRYLSSVCFFMIILLQLLTIYMFILERVWWSGIGPLLILRDFRLTALVESMFSIMSNLVAFVATGLKCARFSARFNSSIYIYIYQHIYMYININIYIYIHHQHISRHLIRTISSQSFLGKR